MKEEEEEEDVQEEEEEGEEKRARQGKVNQYEQANFQTGSK